MKLSTTKTLCDGPTLRQKAVGMPGGSIAQILDAHVRKSIGQMDRAVGRVRIEAVVEGGGSHLARIEDPAKRWFQATGMPASSRPADIRSNK